MLSLRNINIRFLKKKMPLISSCQIWEPVSNAHSQRNGRRKEGPKGQGGQGEPAEPADGGLCEQAPEISALISEIKSCLRTKSYTFPVL